MLLQKRIAPVTHQDQNDQLCPLAGLDPLKNCTNRNSTTFANIGIYDENPFALQFDEMTDAASFSIQVGGASSVTELNVLTLMMLGLAGIGYRRYKAA